MSDTTQPVSVDPVVDRRPNPLKSSFFENTAFLVGDIAVILAAVVLAYWLRFDGVVPANFRNAMWMLFIAAFVLYVPVFWVLGLYRQVWRYVGVDVVLRLMLAVGGVTAVLFFADLAGGRVLTQGGPRLVPLGVVVSTGVLVFLGSAAIRTLARVVVYVQGRAGSEAARRVLVIGAGDTGSLLLRDIENQPVLQMRVIGFLDDDARKRGRVIRGARVLGPVDMLAEVIVAERVDLVFIAIPTATSEQKRHAIELCANVGVETQMVGSIVVGAGTVGVADLRKVGIEDLLGREPVAIDVAGIAETIEDQVVLVTGAAGSIGSELCRQVLKLGPRVLVLVDMDESRLYDVDQELSRTGAQCVRMHICDIRDERKLASVMRAEQPDVVFHAAAYKHVPLMELAPDEAVKANVLGTANVLRACEAAGVQRFVLISTDKAVHPSSVMGQTKAIAERLMLDACRRYDMCVTAVRFGNVLGSRGSVVPLFEEQMRAGGPITVTDPEATRYFMTIPEAARLVLQAAAISDGGDLMVLEMGDPVKIVDLARKMITLAGSDAKIEFTGLRPAEKLHEVLVRESEDLVPTTADKILRVNALPLLPLGFEGDIRSLIEAGVADDRERIEEMLARLVPDSRRGIR